MRMSCPVACAAVLVLVVFSSGCSGTDKSAAAAATSAQGDGIHEYRAVCTETAAHGGNEQVLSKWLETRAQPESIGNYHSNFKAKGHRVRIEERVKPKKATI
jgi:hypothetical protein